MIRHEVSARSLFVGRVIPLLIFLVVAGLVAGIAQTQVSVTPPIKTSPGFVEDVARRT
jgi:hypothetical protein